MKCPQCGELMSARLLHSPGIIVCEERYLQGMWELQREEDAGRTARLSLGHVEVILPMAPEEEKYARCHYCERCELLVVSKSDEIPTDEVPRIAKQA